MQDLKNNIRDYEEFKHSLNIKKQIVRDAIFQGIEFTDGKNISYDLVKSINDENMSEINRLYDELKKVYNAT